METQKRTVSGFDQMSEAKSKVDTVRIGLVRLMEENARFFPREVREEVMALLRAEDEAREEFAKAVSSFNAA